MKKITVLLITTILILSVKSQTVTLTGSGTDADGTITGYAWRKISGPASGIITNPTSATTTVTALTAGVYQFELTVTDNQGATGTDTVQITVLPGNIKPKANAGQDQIITLPSSAAILRGTGTDKDGKITAYKWSKVGTSSAIIWNSNAASTAVYNMTKIGKYSFSLRVKDNLGAYGFDTMNVVVNPKKFSKGVQLIEVKGKS